MLTPFPQTLKTSVYPHRKSLNLGKFGLLNWIELNIFALTLFFFFNGLLRPQGNLQSLICPFWPLGRTLCPRMSQGLGSVVYPGLTFGDEFNHSKYPVSSFPQEKRRAQVFSFSRFFVQHLLPQLPAQVLLPWSWATFAHQVSWCVQMSSIAQNGSNGTKCPYSINFFFSLMEIKHDLYMDTSLEWRGFTPWSESHRSFQKNPNLLVSDLSVTLCVVSLQGGILKGLKVENKIETFIQDGWIFLGNFWGNSQPQLQSLWKNCVSQFIERDGFQFLSNKRNFPSRNWHTGMAKSLDDLMYIWD